MKAAAFSSQFVASAQTMESLLEIMRRFVQIKCNTCTNWQGLTSCTL